MFIAELFTVANMWKNPESISKDEWIKETLLVLKKKEIL